MTSIVTLSGWGQPYNALENIAPGAHHVDYSKFSSAQELFASLDSIACDVVIGWSLGGQLALRAIADQRLEPKALVLLATPFQFVASDAVRCGMAKDVFAEFERDFDNDPAKTLKRFCSLVARNDQYEKRMIRELEVPQGDLSRWRYWLRELEEFSCSLLDFNRLVRTLIIHGREDSLVDFSQHSLFLPFLQNPGIVAMEHCGHAPHLHDEQVVKEHIDAFMM